jgi:hypothetical protein
MTTTMPPYVYVVLKQPIDLDGAVEIVGAFSTVDAAKDACRRGAATYIVARCERDKFYKQGTLLDVSRIVVVA